MEFIWKAWPWYIAGPLIGLTVPALLLLGNKSFGISSSLRHICAACPPANIPYFKYNWKAEVWNLFFVFGIMAGAFIAVQFLQNPDPIALSPSTKAYLQQNHVKDFEHLLPN